MEESSGPRSQELVLRYFSADAGGEGGATDEDPLLLPPSAHVETGAAAFFLGVRRRVPRGQRSGNTGLGAWSLGSLSWCHH